MDIRRKDTQELLKEVFEESVTKIIPLIENIGKTDDVIDQMVYELYGLNEEEIKILENSIPKSDKKRKK